MLKFLRHTLKEFIEDNLVQEFFKKINDNSSNSSLTWYFNIKCLNCNGEKNDKKV